METLYRIYRITISVIITIAFAFLFKNDLDLWYVYLPVVFIITMLLGYPGLIFNSILRQGNKLKKKSSKVIFYVVIFIIILGIFISLFALIPYLTIVIQNYNIGLKSFIIKVILTVVFLYILFTWFIIPYFNVLFLLVLDKLFKK